MGGFRFVSLLAALLWLAVLPSCGQGYYEVRGQVELVCGNQRQLIVRSEGFGLKDQNAIEDAKRSALAQILFYGLEYVNKGEPLIDANTLNAKRSNLWLRSLFKTDTSPYQGFIKGVEVEDEVRKAPSGEQYCRARVMINLEMLARALKANGLLQ